MSIIKLSKLAMRNFKGVKHFEISFGDITDIKGENGTGKTTVFDAFTWLLFDKDSSDRQSFEIKTLDSNNKVVHGLEHEVMGMLNIDGRDVKLTKILKEKWTKKKGEAERQLTGHETLHYINDIPVRQSEFKDAIGNFLNEQLFKLVSSPLYFSTNLKWQDRRKVIIEIIGDIPVERVLSCNSEIGYLAVLMKDMDMDTLRKSISARKKRLNEEIKAIPYRIDELNNSIQDQDFPAIELEAAKLETTLSEIEDKLSNISGVSEDFINKQNRFYSLKARLTEMEFKAKADAENKLRQIQYEMSILNNNMKEAIMRQDKLHKEIKELEAQNDSLKAKWYDINSKELVFDESEFICPTCHRTLDTEDIEAKKADMRENFQADKENSLRKITAEVLENKKNLGEYQVEASELGLKGASMEEKLKALEKEKSETASINLEDDEEYLGLREEAAELESVKAQYSGQVQDIASLKDKKSKILLELEDAKKTLNVREQNERMKLRISQLMKDERSLAQQIAELENQEFLCEEYTRTKVELLESSINSKFKYVRFKLFNTLVNGAVEECCEALINGVPFSSANKASQINAGLDIINALCTHYNVHAPIFIDNREGVNEILSCDSQIINLTVSRDKELVVGNLQ